LKINLKTVSLLLCVFFLMSIAPVSMGEGGDRVNISYLMWGTPEEYTAVVANIERFNASQDRIEVEALMIPWESYMATLNSMAMEGELPDTAMMKEDAVLQWAKQGILADISDMYDEDESKPLDSLAFRFNGIPVAYSAANEVLILYYNKDMFDAAGVEYPPSSAEEAWTWDEFVATAKKLTFDKEGNTPNDEGFDPARIMQYGCLVENLTWQLEVWALSNGGGFYSPDGSEVTIDKPETVEAIQKVADLHLKDHVAPLSMGDTDDGVQRSLLAGICAMTTNGAWNVGTCLATAHDEGIHYGVAVLPYMREKVTICTGGPNVVFSQSKYPAEAMEWLKWYAREENSWGLIEAGIWMPILDSWYTDENLTRQWVENPNFPPYDEYKGAVVDYARDYARSTSWYYVDNTVDFNDLLGAALSDVWTGVKTAEQAIAEDLEALKLAFEGT